MNPYNPVIWANRAAQPRRPSRNPGAALGVALLTLAFAGFAHAAPKADAAPVVAAERAFAADGLALGITQSFLKHSAPTAIVLNPEPQLAKAVYGAAPVGNAVKLLWWPLWAGIAKSGDLGFTTGPYSVNGAPKAWYFTVWAKQPDGSWKWLFDGGPPSDPTGAAPQGSEPAYARAAAHAAGSSATAMADVTKAEGMLSFGAKTDLKAAYLAALAEDGRIVGSKAKPPATRGEVEAEVASRPARIRFSPLGGQASAAGDLAWTYGMAQWEADGAVKRGHYVRIWRYDADGWRLLFDELLPVPPTKP